MSQKPREQNESFAEVGLKLMKECPLCGKNYTAPSLKVIEQQKDTRLVHCTCQHCKQSLLAVIVTTRLGVSSIGILTDLTISDVYSFQNKNPICENDILDFHQFLEKNTKQFSQLFK